MEASRPVARASARTAQESSSLRLKLRTAEGDTVEISLEAQSSRRRERSSARGTEGRISEKLDVRGNRFTASVSVTGDLSDEEMQDIQSLLKSLAGGKPQAGAGELDTISAYRYSFQKTREASESKVKLYG
jgi:hypothetical protein